MENEFRIREEIIARGAEKAEYSPDYSTEFTSGNFIGTTTSKREFAEDFEVSKCNFGADERIIDELSSGRNSPKIGEDFDGTGADKSEVTTGWEAERAFLFATQNQIGVVGGEGLRGCDFGCIGGDILQLVGAIAGLSEPENVSDCTTQIAKTERKRRIGQRDDDHENQGYKFEMQM